MYLGHFCHLEAAETNCESTVKFLWSTLCHISEPIHVNSLEDKHLYYQCLTVLNPKEEQARLLRWAGLTDTPTHSSLKESSWLLNRGRGGRL